MSDDLITRYLALPGRPTNPEAAEILGVSLSRLEKAKQSARLSRRGSNGHTNPAEDRDIVERYKALDPSLPRYAAAKLLGLGEGRLSGALERTGTPRNTPPIVEVDQVVTTRRYGVEALPAGSPETWDVLGFGPWPFRSRPLV